MKRSLYILGIVLALSIVATSCEKAPFLTLSTPRTINFMDQGGTQSITFTANRDWSVSSSDSWCKVSPSSGIKADGNITVTLTCEPNTTYDPRSAALTVRVEELSETITVTQDTNLGLLVSPTSYDLTHAAQSIEVEVRANVKYSVEIDAACKDWITQTGTKALSTEKITFSIAANESYDNREGKITIKQTDGSLSETIVVKQSQTNGLFITTPEYDLSNEDHTLSVEVKANVSFQVTPQVDWIKYVETKALTSSTIVLSIEANKTYDDRRGTVLVKQANGDLSGTITINQKQTDGLFVTPTDVDVDNAEHTVELEVKNDVSYDVVIPDDAKEWISIKSNTATKALADNKVTLAITQNTTYDNREASITIKQTDGSLAETVKIKQAQTDGLIVGKKEYEVGRDGETIEIQLQTNVEYDVIIPEDVKEWVTRVESAPTKALVNESVYLQIAENPTYYNRETSVVIKKKGADLQESVLIKQAQTDVIMIIDEVNSFTIPFNGGDLSFSVLYNVDIEIVPSASWIHQIETKAVNTDTFTFSIDKNTIRSERNGIITIKQKGGSLSAEVTIKQIPFGGIDLGLSVYWDECNLGATIPEEFGDFYAWGELETKDYYYWDTYKWCTVSYDPFILRLTKYNIELPKGKIDNLTKLEPEDDVANVLLGNGWRMPTDEEIKELTEKCSIEWGYKNDVLGYYVTSSLNGNSIFLPATGTKWVGTIENYGQEVAFWASTLWPSSSENADYFYKYFNRSSAKVRCAGLPVRAVHSL